MSRGKRRQKSLALIIGERIVAQLREERVPPVKQEGLRGIRGEQMLKSVASDLARNLKAPRRPPSDGQSAMNPDYD